MSTSGIGLLCAFRATPRQTFDISIFAPSEGISMCAAPTWHLNFGTMFGLLKQGRRRRLRAQLFPKEWLATIQRSALFFRRLSANDQAELLGHIQVFLAEKRFEGCDGLEITDEVRVTIAAQACLLLLHRKTDYFPRLLTILVYPSIYVAEERRHVHGHVWQEGKIVRLGETGR